MVYRSLESYPYGQGTRDVYLLHFSKSIGHAQHYIGQTDRSIEVRLEEHRSGRGARLTQLAVAAGLDIILARTWVGAPRCFEQKLKNRGGARRFCPVCRGDGSAGGS